MKKNQVRRAPQIILFGGGRGNEFWPNCIPMMGGWKEAIAWKGAGMDGNCAEREGALEATMASMSMLE